MANGGQGETQDTLNTEIEAKTKRRREADDTSCCCIVMEITRELYEPNIAIRDRVLHKNVN